MESNIYDILAVKSFLLVIISICLIGKRPRNVNDDKSSTQSLNHYNLTPSEIFEYDDFEKSVKGEIYADDTSKKIDSIRRKCPSPGMERFRRIPALASEKS
jgi:hypothetical protein